MARIPDETIQAIRDRVDLVDLIGRHVTLKKAGRNHKGRCPFHDEKTPSFNVNADRQIFHCFGCGAGGNAFTFLMRHENLTFPEAARALAAEVGIEIEEERSREQGVSEAIFAANGRAHALYREALGRPEGEAARAYLTGRGIDADSIERFGIGFAPDRWDTLVRAMAQADVPAALGVRAGLLAERDRGGHYDRLRGRVIFPIQDVRGRVIGFGGRALGPDQEPKYLNTPESPVYRKREALYGFPQALEPMRRADRAVVAEGYFDVVALQRAGIGEAVATCGTALTPDHARQLKRRTREVVLVFDGDEAGQRAVESALEVLLPEGLRVRAALLPPGEDPDSLLAAQGPEALQRLVDAATPGVERAIARACARGVSTPWEKADAVRAVVPLLARIPDRIERGEFVRRLALSVDVAERDVQAAVRAAARGQSIEEAMSAPTPQRSGPEERWLETLAAVLLVHSDLAREESPEDLLDLIPDGPMRTVIEAILEALARGGAIDPVGLAEQLEPALGSRLMALAVADEGEADRDVAARALRETVSKLRARQQKSERRAVTQRYSSESQPDAEELLAEKERQLAERRRIQGVPDGSTRH